MNNTHRILAITVGDLKVRSWPDGLANRDTVIVDGNYPATTNRCFVLNNAAALVEGLTISNACSSGIVNGSAVSMTAGTLQNCVVRHNITANQSPGAGVFATGASSIITGCRIESNSGYLDGNRRIDAVSGIVDMGCYEHHWSGTL